MYSGLLAENQNIIYSTTDWLESGKQERRPKGEYDKYILCKNCETYLSKFESYAKGTLYGEGNPKKHLPIIKTYKSKDGFEYANCKNVDYIKFKVFLISILWRASISKREFFKEVNLGPHEEIMREMIVNGNAKKVDDYPILLLNIKAGKESRSKIIGQPVKLRQGTRTLYIFMIEGTLFLYNVSGNQIPKIFTKATIRPSNELDVLYLPEESIDSWIGKYFGIKNFTKILIT